MGHGQRMKGAKRARKRIKWKETSERREEKEERGGQKKGDGELLGELEKRESHRSIELLVWTISSVVSFIHSAINRAGVIYKVGQNPFFL